MVGRRAVRIGCAEAGVGMLRRIVMVGRLPEKRDRACERHSGGARARVRRPEVWLERMVTRRMLCGVLRNRFESETAAMEGTEGEGFVVVDGGTLGEMAHVSRVV